MRRFLILLRLDFKVIFRNGFHWVLLITLGVTTVTVHLLPKSIQVSPPRYLYDATNHQAMARALSDELPEEHFLSNETQLIEAVRGGRQNAGILVREENGEATIEIYYNGPMPEKQRKLVEAGLKRLWWETQGSPGNESFRVVELREALDTYPLNKGVVPVLLVFEVIVLGFLFVAVMVFQEKQDGSIRAFRVSPGGSWIYLWSKTVVWVIFTVLYGTALLLLTMGPLLSWLRLLVLLALAGTFMTLLGLLVSVFFRNISEWFFIGVGILVLNMLPQISYLNPAFAPAWITWIPSYPLLFAVRDLLFRSDVGGQFGRALLQIGAFTTVLLPLTYVAIRAKLMREAT
jgi:ABC-2 type transport system permease protein/fluoroquinolone transport system permease protein